MIGILDYNAGNISSVLNAFKYLEIDAKRIETLDEIMKMKGIVIPGVGSFPTAYKNMQNIGITRNFLNKYLKKGKILGICLGMQIMYEYGEGFAALIEEKNIFGVQFHPEKSGENGLRLLKKFGEICYENNSSS